jgi:DNA-binding response OmpR family regulator
MARILVIDDAPVVLTLCRAVLEEAGHEVEVAGGGAEGVRRHRGRPADLVLCDLIMPDQDGFQTVSALRTFSAVPIVVMGGRLSTYPGARSFEDALLLGADRTLRKPFVGAELLLLVGELLRPAG